MLVGVEQERAAPAQMLPERVGRHDLGAERKQIRAVTDELALVRRGLSCDRDAEHHVALTGQSEDQSLKRSEQDVVRSDAGASTDRTDARVEFGSEPAERTAAANERRGERARSSGSCRTDAGSAKRASQYFSASAARRRSASLARAFAKSLNRPASGRRASTPWTSAS